MSTSTVTCVGAVTWDTIALVDRLPSVDGRVEAREIIQACGGPAATAAVTLRRLGIPVSFVGIVGNDSAGLAVLASLRREGVDTSGVIQSSTMRTSRSLITVCGPTRTIVTEAVPASALGGVVMPPDATSWYHVDQLGWPLLPKPLPRGSRLSVDEGNPIEGLRLQEVDLYGPTQARLVTRYPGQDVEGALRRAARDGARMVVATMGSAGSITYDGTRIDHIPAHPVAVTSTLGAGDVFHGAVLAGLINGMSLSTAAGLASEVAARSCTALDGQSAIPRHDDVAELKAWKAQVDPLNQENPE